MTEISRVYPLVRIEAPGVPEPLLEYTVFDTVKDFFRDAEIWRYTVPTLLDWTIAQKFPTLTVGTDIPTGTRIERLDVLKYAADGVSLRTVPFYTKQQLDEVFSDWEVKTGNTPYGFTNDAGGENPIIIPIATEDKLGSLKLRVILVPDTLTDVPDYFYAKFHDAWRWGSLARLLKMPGRDWTDLPMAAYYKGLFEEAVKKAKSQAQSEYGQPVNREMAYGGL